MSIISCHYYKKMGAGSDILAQEDGCYDTQATATPRLYFLYRVHKFLNISTLKLKYNMFFD